MKKPINTKAVVFKLVALIIVLYIWFVIYSGLTQRG